MMKNLINFSTVYLEDVDYLPVWWRLAGAVRARVHHRFLVSGNDAHLERGLFDWHASEKNPIWKLSLQNFRGHMNGYLFTRKEK